MSADADRCRDISFELEYWRSLLDDVGALSDGIEDAASPLADATVAVLSMSTCPREALRGFALDAMDAHRRSIGTLHAMQPRIRSVMKLVEGRLEALSAELASIDPHSRKV
jgi:hypothetical protein